MTVALVWAPAPHRPYTCAQLVCDMAGLQAELARLQGQLAGLEGNRGRLQAEVAALTAVKWVAPPR